MNPLSPFTYYRRHKRSTALLALIIALVTLAVGLMVGVIDSLNENAFLDYAYLDYLNSIYPQAGYAVDPGIAAQVRANPDVERVIPDTWLRVIHPTLIGTFPVRVFAIPVTEMPALLRACGQRVLEGRLPAAHAPEFALSVDTARALGLRLGDRVSRAANPEFYDDLATEMTLVGLLDADPAAAGRNVRMGLASYEYITENEAFAPTVTGLLAIARPGRTAALEGSLQTILGKTVFVETSKGQLEIVKTSRAFLYLVFAIVDVLVAGVAALVVGVINQIAVSRRLPEFGLLQALGWRRGALVRRVTGEAAITAALGWLAGVAGTVALVTLGRELIFAPRGQEWSLSLAPFLFTLPIPLAMVGFTAQSVWRVFRRLDAVAIVERGKLSLEETGQRRVGRSSVRPLSSRTFYLRHRRRGLMLVTAMTLMIFGVASPVFILSPIFDAQVPAFEYLRYVSELLPAVGAELDPGVIAQVRAYPGTARVIPVVPMGIAISVPPANHPYIAINAVSEEDLRYLMDRFGLRLLEGRLPRPRTNEIVLSEALARNRGLHIGDAVGSPVYERDGMPFAMLIVGLLENKGMWMGFASLEYVQSHELTADVPPEVFVAAGAEGQAALEAWLRDTLEARTTLVQTYAEWRAKMERERFRMLSVLAAVELLMAVIAAAALAVLNYIFYSQRRDEFGVLHALGRGRGWLTWRAGRETLVTAGTAWLLGAALCLALILGLQSAVYVPAGLNIDLDGIAPWLFTLPIPLAVAVGNVATIGWMLRGLDSVAVIEGR